jgi:hypothetical protein
MVKFMVDFLNMDFSGINFLGAASGFMSVVEIIMYVAVVGVILWGCLYLMSFKNVVRVRQHTASGYVIIDTKAREFSTKDGAKKWRFLKWIKHSYLAPPSDYLEFTSKGKFSVEADRMLDGVVIWRKRSGLPDTGDSFTSEERTILGMGMRRAEEYRKTGAFNKLMEYAPTIFTIIILILLFAFWGDITNTSIKTLDKAILLEEKSVEAIARLDASIERQNVILEKTYGIKVPSLNGTFDNKGGNLPTPPN